MNDLAVIFKGASDETFYKILAALASMKEKGVRKVKFEEKRLLKPFDDLSDWHGEVQFLSKEALGIFGTKIRRGGRK